MKNFLVIVTALLLFSCQKNKTENTIIDQEKDAKLISSLKMAYGLTTFNIEPSKTQSELIFSSLSASSGVYQKVAPQLLKNSMRIFQNENEGITIAMMRFEDSPEKMYSVKGFMLNGAFHITNEFLFGRKMGDNSNGQIVLTNNDEAALIKVENGVQTISPLDYNDAEFSIIQVTDCYGNHGGTGFCQRESGETFSKCYSAEKDEFCDGFWSCLALDTQPQVLVLIAAACSCSATQCPK